MNALIVTDIRDEYFKENNFLNIEVLDIVSNINKLLSKFEIVIFMVRESNDIFETNIHESLKIENCKKDFYIFKKQKNNNLFKNPEFKELFLKKNVDTIYISGFYLEYEVKKLALASVKSNYKTIVIGDATLPVNDDMNINKILKTFQKENIDFIESYELDEFEKISN
jgi:hypothetical protein